MERSLTNKELERCGLVVQAGVTDGLAQCLTVGVQDLGTNWGTFGWNWNVYELKDEHGRIVYICAGYRNLTGERVPFLSDFERRARACTLKDLSWEKQQAALDGLRAEFVAAVYEFEALKAQPLREFFTMKRPEEEEARVAYLLGLDSAEDRVGLVKGFSFALKDTRIEVKEQIFTRYGCQPGEISFKFLETLGERTQGVWSWKERKLDGDSVTVGDALEMFHRKLTRWKSETLEVKFNEYLERNEEE